MKKLLMFTFAIMAVMAFATAPVFACDGDKASTTTASADKASCSSSKASAKMVNSSEKSCASKASAKLAGDKAACGSKASAKLAGDKAACASKKTADMANYDGKLCNKSHEIRTVSIEGMTCGGCEESIKATLAKAPGVVKVINVSHKDGIALVAVDKNSTCNVTMAKMVTDKGYKAEVVQAVATSSTSGKSCSAAEKAACAAKKDAEKKTDGSL